MQQGLRWICLLAAAVPALCQQAAPNALLGGKAAQELFERTIQLMESTTVAIPELNRAGAPIIENARQTEQFLKQRGGSLPATYSFLTNVRAYNLLADSVPKPFPFPEQAGKQLAELRDSQQRIESHFRALLESKEETLRGSDRDNLKRYAEANARLAAPQPGKPRVVFMGDSITDGWRLNQYFPDRDFVNRGISGQVTGEMLGRFKADVIDLRPEAVLILAGTNDLARGVPLTTIQNNYAMMADLADRHQVKPIFSSVLPVSDYHKDQNPAFEMTRIRPPAAIAALNQWLRSFCQQRGYTYADYVPAVADKTGMLAANLADDGLHPNAEGYRAMAPVAMTAIDKVVGTPTQQKSGKRRQKQKES